MTAADACRKARADPSSRPGSGIFGKLKQVSVCIGGTCPVKNHRNAVGGSARQSAAEGPVTQPTGRSRSRRAGYGQQHGPSDGNAQSGRTAVDGPVDGQ